jgi:hypothetical protein
MPNVFRPRTERVTVVLRDPHPVSVYMATALGRLYGRAIAGDNGAFRYGAPGLSTNRSKYGGYAFPAQMFVGWNPKRVAAGAVRYTPQRLPATSPTDPTDNPLRNAVAMVSAGAGLGY